MITASVTPEVSAAIDEIRADFPEAEISVVPDAEGGARVIAEPIDLKSPLYFSSTWVGFYITHTYPYADIYPHYVRPDLLRSGNVVTPLQPNHEFLGRSAIMVSRRSNRHDPATDTATLKLQKVIGWLNSQQ
jgi:hypothetical protein